MLDGGRPDPHTAVVTVIDAPPRIAVLVPTTGGCARVASLVERPRLARSMATHVDDFRPLPIAEGYHRLVEGPLAALGGAPSHWHLALTERIDTGRSWELPVLLAHRALARGAMLADVDAADLVLWATGAVDGALDPTGETRFVAEKLRHSEALLAEAGPRARLLVGAAAPEAALVTEAARRLGGQSVHTESFSDLERALDDWLGAKSTPAPPGGPAAEPVPTPAAETHEPPETVTVPRVVGTNVRLAVIGAAVATLTAAIAFGLSTFVGENSAGEPVSEMIRLERLTAADREACIDAVLSGRPLAATPVSLEATPAEVPGEPALCALRITARGTTPVRLRLDDRLSGTLIAGDTSAGRVLPVTSAAPFDLVFRRAPTGRTATLGVGRGTTEREVEIRFADPAGNAP